MEKLKADGLDPPLPHVSTPWIIEKLMEIGPIVSAGMGPGAITWRDIAAWQQATVSFLGPWEARLIRRLSTEYLTMFTDARKPECPAPWSAVESVDRDAVAQKVRNEFRAMMAAKRGGNGAR